VGNFIFISILLMFKALQLTEFVLAHGVSLKVIGQLIMFLSVSFLPAILPMSLLFSVLMTYGRLSTDSELIAFKAIGVSQSILTIPAFLLGVAMALVSAQTYFYLGPWGQKQSTNLIAALGSTQVISQIREGTFAEGFYNLVVYANEVNDRKGVLKDVFIYDERSKKMPLTIIAQEGQILSSPGDLEKSTILRLFNGSIHRTAEGVYTKIQFDNYDIFLSPRMKKINEEQSAKALTITELYSEMKKPNLEQNRRLELENEYHKRFALPFACIVFALIGVGMGTVVNRRVAKSGGFVISVGLIVIYWIFFMMMDTLANNGTVPAVIALWTPNVIFLVWAYYSLKMIWNK
jgi:lipopolysaccharide export system permease protein